MSLLDFGTFTVTLTRRPVRTLRLRVRLGAAACT